MNIAGPLATLIFAITVLTVFGGLFAYGVYKARERTRKKPAATKKSLQYFVEYALPMADVVVAGAGPSGAAAQRERRPWGLYLLSMMAIGGLVTAGLFYYRSGRKLVLQGAWAVGSGSTKEYPGPPERPRPPRGATVSFAKLQTRRASLFPKPSFDANHDDILSPQERARLHKDVPLTILLTVDDNGQPQGLKWLLETFLKHRSIWGNVTFFITGNYAEGRPSHIGGPITQWWNTLSNENFVGLHGQTHEDGSLGWSTARWLTEHNATMSLITEKVTAPDGWAWDGYPWGSRAPYLSFGDSYFAALEQVAPRVVYDASMIVHPIGAKMDGPRDLSWPFALTDGHVPPDVELPFSDAQQKRVTIGPHPIVEVPVYSWAVKTKAGAREWVPSLDVNLFKEQGCPWDGPNREILEAFEANLRSHYEGNRPPFHLGLHAQNYTLDRRCERATMEMLLSRVEQYVAAGWNLKYESMPRLLEWMASD